MFNYKGYILLLEVPLSGFKNMAVTLGDENTSYRYQEIQTVNFGNKQIHPVIGLEKRSNQLSKITG